MYALINSLFICLNDKYVNCYVNMLQEKKRMHCLKKSTLLATFQQYIKRWSIIVKIESPHIFNKNFFFREILIRQNDILLKLSLNNSVKI